MESVSAELGLTLGWTLAHTLWQTTLLAAAFALWQRHVRQQSVARRYHVALAALAISLTVAGTTLAWLATLPETSLDRDAVATTVAASAVTPPAPAAVSSASAWLRPRGVDTKQVLAGLAAFWAAGAALQLLRILGGLLLANGIRRRAVPVAREDVLATRTRIASRLGMSRPPVLLQSPEVEGPATWGWLRPVVLFPTDLAWGSDERSLAPLLAHEFAHVRGRDFAANLAQAVIDALLFHCPGARWLSGEVRRLREYRCDDEAVALLGRVDYVRALAGLVEPRRPGLAAVAPAAAGPRLVDRIRRLSEGDHMPSLRPRWTVGLVLAAALIALLGKSLLTASRRQVERTRPRGQTLADWTCPALLPPWGLTPAALTLGNEFVPQDAPSRHFYCNPVLLDGRPLDWQTLTVETRGTLTLVHGDPASPAATRIAFSISLRRNGQILDEPKSDLPRRPLYQADLGKVLELARPGDHLILEPVERPDWRAKRILELGC